MTEIRNYVDEENDSPFAKWFDELDPIAAAKVTLNIARMGLGNFSNVKGVGAGVFECRVYFGKDGDSLIILLGGGTKKRQRRDIEDAKGLWVIYRDRKHREGSHGANT